MKKRLKKLKEGKIESADEYQLPVLSYVYILLSF